MSHPSRMNMVYIFSFFCMMDPKYTIKKIVTVGVVIQINSVFCSSCFLNIFWKEVKVYFGPSLNSGELELPFIALLLVMVAPHEAMRLR